MDIIIIGEWLLKILGIYALIQIGIIGLLWLIHDRPLIATRSRIHDIPGEINESNRGRGILHAEQERQINIAQRPLKAELELREYKRQIFLERARLISLIRLK